jgi:RNA polymerase sigma factor (sigma-70 family)
MPFAPAIPAMSSPSVTRASLLLRIRNPSDQLAWGEFVQLYAPLIHAYGMHRGLQDADAADLVQEVLRRVSRAAGQFEYDRQRGSFRGWLFTVTRNELRKMAAKRGRQANGSGDTQILGMLQEQPDERVDNSEWDREYQWRVFEWAAERVRNEFREPTWQAFWRTVAQHQPIERVAQELGLTVGAVYIARSRVTARIRQEIASAEGEHAVD